MSAYLFSEKTRDSQNDKQCIHSFPNPVEQIKLPHGAHTKSFQFLLRMLSSNTLRDSDILSFTSGSDTM